MSTVPPSVVAGLPVDPRAFHDRKGRPSRRLEKRKTKLLASLGPHLGRHLEGGEIILDVTNACSPMGVLEQLTTGWIIQVLKRCVLVLTDRRLLHVPLTPRSAWRHVLAEIRPADVMAAKVGGLFGKNLKLTYRSGRKETFLSIPAEGARRLREGFLPRIAQGEPTPAAARRHRCPRCSAPLRHGEWVCPACRLDFKTPGGAAAWSILVPGGGYFYTRHPILGLFDFLTEAGLLLIVALGALAALAPQEDVAPADAWATVGLFGGLLVVEKVITIYHAQHHVKEFLPTSPAEAASPPPPRSAAAGGRW
jgi:hypothetical protein